MAPRVSGVAMIPVGEARELHGREALCALEDHFGWRRTRRELMVALWEELHEREQCATRPMALDPIANVRPRPQWVPAWEFA